jgi:hypothetical protein
LAGGLLASRDIEYLEDGDDLADVTSRALVAFPCWLLMTRRILSAVRIIAGA